MSEITGKKHGFNICIIKIARYEMSAAGVLCIRSAGDIAAAQTDAAVRLGVHPDMVKRIHEQDFIILKR